MKQPTPIFEALSDGKGSMYLSDYNRSAIKRWLSTFKNGIRLDIIIRKHSKSRTNQQNAYYWGVLIPILADFFGHDNAEDMHEELKEHFNPVESKVTPGKKIGGTTTKLSTDEFMGQETSYIDRICRWAASDYNIYIPPPQKVDK